MKFFDILGLAVALSSFLSIHGKELPKGFSLYCKESNCYDVLGVSQSAEVTEIKRAFRKLSLIHHPDKSSDPESADKFLEIANANEILSNEDLRKAYDDFLEHPERHVWQHYSRYYQAYYAPKSDLRLVVLGLLAALSAMQYASARFKRGRAVRAVLEHTKTRLFIKQRIYELGGKDLNLRKKDDYATYNRLEAQAEREVLDKTMINGVRLSDPIGADDVVLGRLALLPLDLLHWAGRRARWLILFTILRREYGEAEREEVTRGVVRRALGVEWEALPEQDRLELVGRELWKPDNLERLKQEEAELAAEDQRRRAQTGRYKSYKRWAKRATQ